MILSILIAAYNVESFIAKCIESCYIKELETQYEIIVVDDGSMDNTRDAIQNLVPIISNLKIINKHNEGLGAARNTGIENAKGYYIWMIDGDDYLQPEVVSSLIELLNKKNCDVFAINYNIVNEKNEIINIKYPAGYIGDILSGSEYYANYFHNSYTWQYIFKRNIFVENNLFFKKRINMQDSEILPKIMYFTKSVRYVDLVGYNYVQQHNSFTNSVNPEKRYKYFESIIAVRNSLIDFAETIKNKDHILYNSIHNKIDSFHQIVFNHLIFYKYEINWFEKNIILLKNNGFYPLKFEPSGKLKFVKWSLNRYPLITKKIIDMIR